MELLKPTHKITEPCFKNKGRLTNTHCWQTNKNKVVMNSPNPWSAYHRHKWTIVMDQKAEHFCKNMVAILTKLVCLVWGQWWRRLHLHLQIGTYRESLVPGPTEREKRERMRFLKIRIRSHLSLGRAAFKMPHQKIIIKKNQMSHLEKCHCKIPQKEII